MRGGAVRAAAHASASHAAALPPTVHRSPLLRRPSAAQPPQVIVAPRSNNLMATERMQAEFPDVLPIKESLIK